LLCSFAITAPIYARALRRAGVPAAAPAAGDFFAAIEVSVMLSLLRIIDNRRQDIPLIAVLRSPLFFFSADDLARVRLCVPGADFCTALEAAAASGDGQSAAFLERLDGFAAAARDLTAAGLIRKIYRDTACAGVFAALPGGSGRVRNLERLYQMALSFRPGGALALFISYIDARIAAGETPGSPDAGAGVRLMSIHKSKGLEFPFVILPDLTKAFNQDDARGPVLFHPHLGLGLTLREPALRLEYKTAAHAAVAARIRREGMWEELRKLYVAMTRAGQKLILIMAAANLPKKLAAWAEGAAGETVPPGFMLEHPSAAAWLCAALLRHPAAGAWRGLCDTPPLPAAGEPGGLRCFFIRAAEVAEAHAEGVMDADAPAPENLDDIDAALSRMALLYPHAAAAALPSKLTPTGVKRLIPEAGVITGAPGGKPRVRRYGDASGLDALSRGSALHAYLRHMDYAACGTVAGAEADILRVVMAGHLTAETASAVPPAMIAALAASPLGRRVRDAGEVLREYQFSALFTPDDLLGNGIRDEQVLLNGAIDLLLVTPEGLEVADFKSDRIPPGQEAVAASRHSLQLKLYAKAAEAIFGLPVRRRTVYFLETGGEAAVTD
jgi:ATP-dependent helicase/nuclease subunit A